MRVVVAGAVLAAATAACLGSAPRVSPPLAGRTFVAVEFVQDGEHRPVWLFGALALQFTADGRYIQQGACNAVHGTYRIEGGRLRTVLGGTTDSGCGIDGGRTAPGYGPAPERWHVDGWRVLDEPLEALYLSDPAVRWNGHRLTLTSARARLTLREFPDGDALARTERAAAAQARTDPRWATGPPWGPAGG